MTKRRRSSRSIERVSSKSATTRQRRSPSASSPQQVRLNRIITTTILLVVMIFAAVYWISGSDPIGLFSPLEQDPIAERAPLVVTGDWWRVDFTEPRTVSDPNNPVDSIPEGLFDYINSARETIHIAAFEFNLTPVAEALIEAQARGVQVRWITDDEYGLEADEDEGHGQFGMLQRSGIEIRDDERTALMHNKFLVFDSQIVWTGSTNLTVNGFLRNNNNVLVIHSLALAAIYEREFAEMWAGEFGPTSPSTVEEQTVTIDQTPVQILFAAEDDVIDRLIPLIEDARTSIRFMAFSFTNDEMGHAVLERARAGVDVKGIFETRGSETEYSEMPTLYCARVPVRQDGNPGTLHHKVLVIDDRIVVTGSLNFSNNADEDNDENVVIVTNTDIASHYLLEFDRRWDEAGEPDAVDMRCG